MKHHNLCSVPKKAFVFQLFKRRNVATVEDDGTLEEDGMVDSGYLESQVNNMDPLVVGGKQSNFTFVKL